VFCVDKVESAFIYASVLNDVEIPRQEGKRYWTSDVDSGILEFAFNEEGDGYEAARGGLGKVARPLVHANGAHNLLGLSDLVHLRDGGTTRQDCGNDDRAE
jgi:hypothetical protein